MCKPVPESVAEWEEWGDWGECSTANTCGSGVKVRHRGCTDGGTPEVDRFCRGASNQTAPCEGINCHGNDQSSYLFSRICHKEASQFFCIQT